MKIVFLITRLDYSGAPKIMAWVANQMALCGHEVKIMTMYAGDSEQSLNDKVILSCLDLHRSRSRVIRNTWDMLASVNAVSKAVKKEKPDVVVTFLDAVGYMYILKNHLTTKFKVLASERSDPYARRGLTGKIRRKILELADYIVFQTEGARSFYKDNKRVQERSTVIPNPIIPKNSTSSRKNVNYSERDNRIVSVGRLDMRQKRYDVMIDAFELVHNKHPELTLNIYGDGQDKNTVQQIIEQKKMTDCVFLMGRTDNVEEEIYNARAFVMTSDFEGIPNALIEAMLAGVPSVATDCSPGGAALLVKDRENGMLVPRSDAKSVSEALIELVENKDLSDKLSNNAPLILNNFSEEKISIMWRTCFDFKNKQRRNKNGV